MEFLKFMFSPFVPKSYWQWGDYVLAALMALAFLVALFLVCYLVFYLLYSLYRVVCFEFSYARATTQEGEVLEKEYTPSSMYTTSDGKTTTTHYTSAKYEVTFKTDLKTTTVDSQDLYDSVEKNEKVSVVSQARYAKPRFWHGEWDYDGNRLVSITTSKGVKIPQSEAKMVSYFRS